MKLITGSKGSGKTSRLIQMVTEKGGYIVCRGHTDAIRIVREAEEMGHVIRFPLTYSEFAGQRYSPGGIEEAGGFYIDGLRALVEFMARPVNIHAATMEVTEDAEAEERRFPISPNGSVPWSIAEKAYEEYVRRNEDAETLEDIAKAGGFRTQEFAQLYGDARRAEEEK